MNGINPLSKNFTIKSLLKFAFPTILMMIFMGLYTVIDTIFVARFVDTNALSALNIVCPVINLIVGLGTMLATGGSAIIVRKYPASAFSKPGCNSGTPLNWYGAWDKRKNRKYFIGLYFYSTVSNGH